MGSTEAARFSWSLARDDTTSLRDSVAAFGGKLKSQSSFQNKVRFTDATDDASTVVTAAAASSRAAHVGASSMLLGLTDRTMSSTRARACPLRQPPQTTPPARQPCCAGLAGLRLRAQGRLMSWWMAEVTTVLQA